MSKRRHTFHTLQRSACRKPADARAALDASVDAAVKAAYLEMQAAGVYPSVARLTRAVKAADWIVDNARSRLIETLAVPVDVRLPNAARESHDDPFTEVPDDPDADEIQRRIAEVRAEKEATRPPTPTPMGVMRAKQHRRLLKKLAA